MAIFFPPEVPVKWYKWADRAIAAEYDCQYVDEFDTSMYQVTDVNFNSHRLLILDNDYAILGEATGDDLDIRTIGSNNVHTFTVDWSDYFSTTPTRGFLAIVDANINKYAQNYLPSGDMADNEAWTLHPGITIGSGVMTFTGTSSTAQAINDTPLFSGKGYTYSFTIDSISGSGIGSVKIMQGSTTITTQLNTGTYTGTFTSDGTDFIIEFGAAVGSATIVVDDVNIYMDFDDVVPEWISAPFCIDTIADNSSWKRIHGCANNDYFNMYFETTGFIPSVRVPAEIRETKPKQDVEQLLATSGNIINHYVRHVSQFQLRVDWIPGYLVGFMSLVFYLDKSYVDNVSYTATEEPEVLEDQNAPYLKAFNIPIGLRANGVSFKRIVNDPDANECLLPTGTYKNQLTQEEYTSQNNAEKYYQQ